EEAHLAQPLNDLFRVFVARLEIVRDRDDLVVHELADDVQDVELLVPEVKAVEAADPLPHMRSSIRQTFWPESVVSAVDERALSRSTPVARDDVLLGSVLKRHRGRARSHDARLHGILARRVRLPGAAAVPGRLRLTPAAPAAPVGMRRR